MNEETKMIVASEWIESLAFKLGSVLTDDFGNQWVISGTTKREVFTEAKDFTVDKIKNEYFLCLHLVGKSGEEEQAIFVGNGWLYLEDGEKYVIQIENYGIEHKMYNESVLTIDATKPHLVEKYDMQKHSGGVRFES